MARHLNPGMMNADLASADLHGDLGADQFPSDAVWLVSTSMRASFCTRRVSSRNWRTGAAFHGRRACRSSRSHRIIGASPVVPCTRARLLNECSTTSEGAATNMALGRPCQFRRTATHFPITASANARQSIPQRPYWESFARNLNPDVIWMPGVRLFCDLAAVYVSKAFPHCAGARLARHTNSPHFVEVKCHADGPLTGTLQSFVLLAEARGVAQLVSNRAPAALALKLP